jgi:hypothetical protein
MTDWMSNLKMCQAQLKSEVPTVRVVRTVDPHQGKSSVQRQTEFMQEVKNLCTKR